MYNPLRELWDRSDSICSERQASESARSHDATAWEHLPVVGFGIILLKDVGS